MNEENVRIKDPVKYRQLAEARYRENEYSSLVNLSQEELHKIIYDLKIRQIELELQNEELKLMENPLYHLLEMQNNELKQKQEELVKYQLLLAETERIGRVGGWELDIDTGKQIWTEGTKNIHEVSSDYEPTLESGISFYTSGSLPIISQAVKRAIEYQEPFDLQLEILTAKGSLLKVNAIGKVDSKNRRIYGFFQDITARNLAEEKLKKSEERYKKITSGLTDYLYTVNLKDGKVVETIHDETCLIVTGYTSKEFLEDKYLWVKMVDPQDKELVVTCLNKVLKGETIPPFEHRIICKNGETRWISNTTFSNFDSNGMLVSYDGVIKNITDRKQAEEKLVKYTDHIELKNIELDMALYSSEIAIERANEMARKAEMANKSKSVFLANMSHEIRTPLNAIIGFSQLMRRDRLLTDSQKEYNSSIIRAGEYLLELINDILELSKVEAGRVVLNPTNVNLHSILDDIRLIFKARAESKRLQFNFEKSEDLPFYIFVDESKLRRIFINLIGNAVKFTEEGSVTVQIKTEKIDDSKDKLIVKIHDTGPGIPENEIGDLFRHFVQTSSGIKKGTGTGLGLALSRELAILMGGNITVLSEIGFGSVFTFYVEIKKGKNEKIENNSLKNVIKIEDTERPHRVLVVDDKEENLYVVGKLLKMVGFETHEAINGEDAVKKFNEWNPDLILMDLRMPVMDGYEATRQIKLTEKGKLTPIVALTASTFEEEKNKIEILGMQGYIRKPFTENELFSVIGKLLGIRYIYDDSLSSQSKYDKDDEGMIDDIMKLPDGLVSKLLAALSAADLDRVIELLDEIDAGNIKLSDYLKQLANNYDYDYLKHILNKKRGISDSRTKT